MIRIVRMLCILVCLSSAIYAKPVANWTERYLPCSRHSELLKKGPMNLGVRFATGNPALVEEFKSAMDFWATVLDLEWYEEDSSNCSIQVIDGARELFSPIPQVMAARSQFPDRRLFEGWIVFNPAVTLSRTDMYRIAVHEIGHLFGLQHSLNVESLMYGLNLDCSQSLDADDLASLAAHHKLRVNPTATAVKLTERPHYLP